jgi:hypothetical protein
MLDRILAKAGEWRFDRTAVNIRNTPPLEIVPGKVTFVSLVCHKDLDRYLLAIKSVYKRVGAGSIAVLDDGTLTDADRNVLNYQLGNPRYFHKDDIDTGPCPSYICWRRIMLILDLCQEGYVVQVDSDIVARAPLEEALAAIEADEAFMIVNKTHPGHITLKEMSKWVKDKGWQGKTVQMEAERILCNYPQADEKRYLRGTAAFVGWPMNCATKEQLLDFSQFIESEIGPLWREWGSEQTSTNYLIANCPKLKLLEHPKYVNHFSNSTLEGAALVHFFGSHRYVGGRYLKYARSLLRELNSTES